ncbi:MAG TPA: helix-turn-helix domain-containing protein [Solirubrobacterales bacterium]
MIEKTGSEEGIDQRLVDLASNSLGLKALVVLNERTAAASELAATLGADAATMRVHLEKLRDQGLIEVVDDATDGGVLERRYRALVRALWSNDEWASLSPEDRRQLSAWIVAMIAGDAEQALEAGTFNARTDSHASRVVSVVDERGWRELTRIFAEALEASFAVQAESAERLAESGEDGITVMSAMLCFEMPAPQPRSTS